MVTDAEVARKFMSLQHSAHSRGIEFNLSLRKVRYLLNAKKCYFTGVEFTPDGRLARSIDRLDSNKGYVDDNVVPCTIRINTLKADLSIDEVKQIFRGLVKKGLIQ